MNLSRASALAVTKRPFASTACTWITRLARSTPTRTISPRVTSLMGLPLFRFRLKVETQSWRFATVDERWEVPSYSIEGDVQHLASPAVARPSCQTLAAGEPQ